jgi:hypothetical protein
MASRINWKLHIEAWQASGLSQAAYCRLHRLGMSSFSAKLRTHRASPPPAPLPAASGLVPARVGLADIPAIAATAGAPADKPLVLLTASGHRLELPPSCEPRWLAELLRCLG